MRTKMKEDCAKHAVTNSNRLTLRSCEKKKFGMMWILFIFCMFFSSSVSLVQGKNLANKNKIDQNNVNNETISCNICKKNKIMMQPLHILPKGIFVFINNVDTCKELEQNAQTGQTYNKNQCRVLRRSKRIKELCGCKLPPSTIPETIDTTLVPTSTPTSVPTSVPTSLILGTMIQTTNQILVRLFRVPGIMSDTIRTRYTDILQVIIADHLVNTAVLVDKLSVNLIQQQAEQPERPLFDESKTLKKSTNELTNIAAGIGTLEDIAKLNSTKTTYYWLDTWINVTGMVSESHEQSPLNVDNIIQIITNNQTILITKLKSSDLRYFYNLQKITVSDPLSLKDSNNISTTPPEPIIDNITNNSSTKETTTTQKPSNKRKVVFITILIIILIVVFVVTFIICYRCLKKTKGNNKIDHSNANPELLRRSHSRYSNDSQKSTSNTDDDKEKIKKSFRSSFNAIHEKKKENIIAVQGSQENDNESRNTPPEKTSPALSVISEATTNDDDTVTRTNVNSTSSLENKIGGKSISYSWDIDAYSSDYDPPKSEASADKLNYNPIGEYQSQTRYGSQTLESLDTKILSGEGTLSSESSAASKLRKYCLSTKTIIAPRGKLNVTVDTTSEGPVVYKVNDANNALAGKLLPGDIIISINGIDTRSMSSNDMRDLMIQSLDKVKIIKVLREDFSSMMKK